MKNIFLFLLVTLLVAPLSYSQNGNYNETNLKINQFVEGTLTSSTKEENQHLVIFIQGSGPTDRDGNQPMMKNDGIKKISRKLADSGISSFRFDKRIFKMNELKIKEKDLRFHDFITDVGTILEYFKTKSQYKNIILAGHSQGSLIGMLAAQNSADAFISLAGVAEPIDKIIIGQIQKQAPGLTENASMAFNEISETGKTTNYHPMLESIFKPDVQPFLRSWMRYDPSTEIKKLEIPVLIVQGTADIQVEIEQAEKLKASAPTSKLVILENMNHVFRKIEDQDRLVNLKSYNESNQALHPELITTITTFIKELN